jgi:O-antigen/teichoic acid export membrane protein
MTIRRLFYNALFLLGSSLGSAAASFFFSAYAAQRLGVEGFGSFSTVQILVTMFSVVTEIGLMNVVVRAIAREKERSPYIAGNYFTMKLGLGLVGFVMAAAAGHALGYEPGSRQLITIYALSLLFVSGSNAGVAVFNGHEKMGYSTLVSTGSMLGYVTAMIALALGYGLEAVFLAMVLSSSLAFVATVVVLYSQFSVRRFLSYDKDLWHQYFVAALPFGITAIIGMIGVSAGPLILSKIVNEEAVGYYNIASKVINVSMLVIAAYNAAVYPVFSRLQASSEMRTHQGYQLSMKIMMLVGFSFATGLTVVAGKVIRLIFPGYEPAIPALQMLAWFAFFALLSTITFNVLYAEGRQGEVAVIMAVGAGASLVVNYIAIPFLSATGVGLALVVFTAVQYALSYRKLSHKYPLNIWKMGFQTTLVGLVVALVGVAFQSWNLLLLMLVMGLAFLAMALVVRIFESEDLTVLANLPGLSHLLPKITRHE